MHVHSHGAHDHGHDHGHGSPARILAIALALTTTFIAVEFVAAHLTGSLALLADAWHMVSDAGSLALALGASVIARRPRSAQKTFGYKRLEVLAALANGVLLGVAAVLIVIEAIERLRTPEPVEGLGVIVVGAAGLFVNLLSAWILMRGAADSVNVQAALAHVLGDALGSVAAILAGAIVYFTGATRADPILSLFVAVLLLWGAWRLVRETAHILMEGTPAGIDPELVERTIRDVAGVDSVHDLHIWSITSGEPAITAHVVLSDGGWHGEDVAQAVSRALERRFHLHHATIQPEPAPRRLVQLGRRDADKLSTPPQTLD